MTTRLGDRWRAQQKTRLLKMRRDTPGVLWEMLAETSGDTPVKEVAAATQSQRTNETKEHE